jgi:hypothetical protein
MDGGASVLRTAGDLEEPGVLYCRYTFFESDRLPHGNHVLEVTAGNQTGWLQFHRADIEEDPSRPTTTGTQGPSSTPGSSTPESTNQTTKGVPVPTVAGIVVGIVGAFVLVLVALFCLRRRRKSQRHSTSMNLDSKESHYSSFVVL